ncbi:type VII secretion protein EssB [Peribacillus sp. SCS-26]|uniref:type VII secretion protein EssB n=1 Tax=Paraperibacillus marinus TaxID=3115295 RepID=UPI003905B652
MEGRKPSYLEELTTAGIKRDGSHVFFTLQRSRIKLHDRLEISFLQELESPLKRGSEVSEDEAVIKVELPEGYLTFGQIQKKTQLARLFFAHQVVKKAMNHGAQRLNLVVSPENIVADPGLTPHFLYYGVKESLPPYEKDEERLLKEVKAAAAVIADGKHSFNAYYKYHQTIKLSQTAKDIMAADSFAALESILEEEIKRVEQKESTYAHIPLKRWKITRYSLIGAAVLLLPAIIYILYSFFFQQPKMDAYVKSGEYFLEDKYSSVIEELEGYDAEDMPYVVQYELASSYVKNESLGDEQRAAVNNLLTLQTEPKYFLYWIYIGRGMNKEAVDLARALEFRDLVIYGLLKYKEDIKADDDLTGEEKQEELDAIEQEVGQYEKDVEEQKKLQEEEKKQAEEQAAAEQAEKEAEAKAAAARQQKEAAAEKKAGGAAANAKAEPKKKE